MFIVPYDNPPCRFVCRASVVTLKETEGITGMMTMYQEVTMGPAAVAAAVVAEAAEVDKGGANVQEDEALHVVEVVEEAVDDLDRVLILLPLMMVSW
jgi:hypothetical protein